MRDKTVLVTGGAGFIGSHLVDRLLDLCRRVIVYDNFDDFYQGKEMNLIQSGSSQRFQLARGDILDFNALQAAMKHVDVVFHLAAQPGVSFSMKEPAKTHAVNATGTLNVLQAATQAHVERLIFSSSSSVYGQAKHLPIGEEDSRKPISVYGCSKLAGEEYCRVFKELFKLPTVVLRYHTVIGPRQRPDMALSRWIKSILEGEKPIVYGDGDQTRDFIYVGDVVDGTVEAATAPDIEGEVFNIGSGRRTRIIEVLDQLIDLIGVDIEPSFSSARAGDATNTWANIDKAQRTLDFNPKTSLKDGLQAFLDWYYATHPKP